jgi:outer membrane lipoprotein-sorting protein
MAVFSFAAYASNKAEAQELLGRMDKAAAGFKAMTAQVTHVTHTEVLNEDSTESGTVIMQKLPSGQVGGRVDIVSPDPHNLVFEKTQVHRYFPKIKTLEIYDLGEKGELLDKFMMIGFGTSGAELAKDYDVTVLGIESLKDQPGKFVHARLLPKSADVRQYVKSTELWIPEGNDPYPVREKILQPSGDYLIFTYNEMKINPPLRPDALQLKLPSGVNTVHPGK